MEIIGTKYVVLWTYVFYVIYFRHILGSTENQGTLDKCFVWKRDSSAVQFDNLRLSSELPRSHDEYYTISTAGLVEFLLK